MTTEPKARIEKVFVKVGELFPLAFHDEVLECHPVEPTNTVVHDRLSLTILRRGL